MDIFVHILSNRLLSVKKLYLCEIETVDYINNTKLEILKETKKLLGVMRENSEFIDSCIKYKERW